MQQINPRLFIAIPIPDELRVIINQWCGLLKERRDTKIGEEGV